MALLSCKQVPNLSHGTKPWNNKNAENAGRKTAGVQQEYRHSLTNIMVLLSCMQDIKNHQRRPFYVDPTS